MSGGAEPSSGERASGPLASFLEVRAAMLAAPPDGGAGRALCGALTEALDEALRTLVGGRTDAGVAVVAIGGYGRGELCLHSDLDVMLLGRGADQLVQPVLYPLWDTRVRVGHSVRTVREAVAAARDRVETLCSLLTARLVVGDPTPLADLEAGLAGLLRRERGRLTAVLAIEESQRRDREPYHLQEVDVKGGRGALRSFHALDWDRHRSWLLGLEAEAPAAEEREAREALLGVRNALHAVNGRAVDVYATELRARVAAWMGEDAGEVGRRLYRAVRVGDRLAGRFLSDLPSDPVAAAGRRVAAAVRSRWGRDPGKEQSASAPLVLAVAALDRPGAAFTPAEEAQIRIARPPGWTDGDRRALVQLLAAGRVGWQAFERLVELGWVARAIPEWVPVRAAPQIAPFHAHPVDVHLWRTVHEALWVTGPDGDEPWCREVADDLGSLDELLLACLFHDIGKGLAGDHAQVGAEVTEAILGRAGFGSATALTLGLVVRHHLLLPRVATRRDLDDPETIRAAAESVGDVQVLRLLYLLSVADARATGPTSWDPWKASLVRTLFARVADELAHRGGVRRVRIEEAVVEGAAKLRGCSTAQVVTHADGMPPGYLLRFGAEEVARHLRLVEPPPAPGEVRLDVRHAAPVSSVVLATTDRPGLLTAVCGVLALHNVSVRDARFSTRSDGVVIDSFQVEDALGTGMVGAARWPAIRDDLGRALAGELALEDRLAEKAAAYRRRGPAVPVRVTVEPRASGELTVVEVRGGDRVGLLHDLGKSFSDLGLDVHLAKIDTRGPEVVDVFYVRGEAAGGWDAVEKRLVTVVGE